MIVGRARHVVVLGLMGAGKTSVGRALATRLGWIMSDSDEALEREHGLTVRDIRDELGTDALHALEARHLLHALGGPGPAVIAAAASVVDAPACRTALGADDIAVVWLKAAPAFLAGRFASGHHRPVYGAGPAEFLARQAAERYPRLAALATVVIDAEEGTADEQAARALRALEREGWVAPRA